MTPIEILAIIFATLILVKLLFIIFKPTAWVKITDPLLKNIVLTTVIFLILTIIVGYYIFSSLNIIQVAAVMLFTSLLMGIGFFAYPQTLLRLRKEVLEEEQRKAWLAIIIWAAIAIWTLVVVFA